MVAAAFTPTGLFQFPRELLVGAGPDALYSLGLDFGAAFLGLWLWFQVNRRAPDQQVGGVAGQWVGPVVAWPLGFATVILHVLLAVIVVGNFALLMQTFFLPNTPLWGIVAPVVGVGLYMAWFDTPTLARTVQVVYAPTLALTMLIGSLITPQLTQTYAMIPSGHFWVGPILMGAYKNYVVFWGYEVTVTLYPYVEAGHRRQSERMAYLVMAGVFLFLALGYLVVVGVAGLAAYYFQWPAVSVMRLANLSTFVINKLGLLTVLLWSMFVLNYTGIRLWCVSHDLMPLWRLTSLKAYRWFLVGYAVVIVVGALAVANVANLVGLTQTWLLPVFVIYNFGLPPLLLAGAAWARRRGRSAPVTTPPG
jgi:spore germination protein